MERNVDLLKDPVKKLIVTLAMPVMAAALLRTSFEFVDMIFASRLGGVQVASVAFVGPIFKLVSALGLGLATGGVSLIAKFIGQKRFKDASNYAVQLRFITLFSSIVLCISGLMVTDLILPLLGLTSDLLDQSLIYTKIRFYSIPFMLIFQLYMSFYKSQGKMNITLKMAFIGLIGNTILNALFIFVFDLGISGLAYGTLITQILQALIIIIWYHMENHDFKLYINIFKDTLDFKAWKKILKVCLPLSLSQSSTDVGFLLINSIIISYGYEVVAGFAIGNQINSLFFGPSTAIGQALTPLIAQNWGKNAIDRIKKTMKTGVIYSIIFGVFGAVFLHYIRKPLSLFFAKDDIKTYINAVNYLSICSWSLIGWSVFQSFSGIFNGFQKTQFTMLINMVRLWGFRIPLLLVFKYIVVIGPWGVWSTMFVSNMATAFFAIFFYYKYIPGILKTMDPALCRRAG
jgi:putative MATE family efflux protein